MKYLFFTILFCLPTYAQIPGLQNFAKQAMEACKEDKSKLSGCESYTKIKPLKECLLKNKEKLSTKCKTALKLAK